MNNRSQHQSGDPLCSFQCPGLEQTSPANFFLSASALPRLWSVCSQHCPAHETTYVWCGYIWMFHKAQTCSAHMKIRLPTAKLTSMHYLYRHDWPVKDRTVFRCFNHRASTTQSKSNSFKENVCPFQHNSKIFFICVKNCPTDFVFFFSIYVLSCFYTVFTGRLFSEKGGEKNNELKKNGQQTPGA